MEKRLHILIGPKGSGKTTIGTLIAQRTDIHFLRVEPIWLGLETDEDGWEKVEASIDALFLIHDRVMIESLGAGEGFARMYASLAGKYSVKLIRVVADLDTCLARVKTRNSRDHIPVSDDQVEALNRIAAIVDLDWDLEIDNNEPISEEELLTSIGSV
jgi:predicted ABC-type ATPase